MIARIKNILLSIANHLDPHTLQVVKESVSSTIVKVAGIIIGLFVSVFLGRTLGADGLGIINLANRIVSILLVIGLLGMPQVIIKKIAISHDKKDDEYIGNVMFTSYLLNGGFTLVITVALILLSPWISKNVFHEPRLTYPLVVALIVMIPQVFSRIFSSALIGVGKIWQSNLVDQTLSITITGLLITVLWLLKYEITINLIAICYGVGRVFVTISMFLYWRYLFKYPKTRRKAKLDLLKIAIPIFIVTGSLVITTNVDVIILGWLRDARDVGLYTVASRAALLISFFLQVTNSAVSPKIASLYNSNKKYELEKMIQKVTRGLFLIGILFFFIILLYGKQILSIWGEEFGESYLILVILSFAQFINLGTGAVGLLLIMANYEKLHAKISVSYMILNVVLNIILIYYLGIIGAAIATALTISLDNITKVFFVKKYLNILTVSMPKIK